MTAPVIFIAGAGPGIGMAVARRFAAGGWNVGLIARNPQRLNAQAAKLRASGTQVHAQAADCADEEGFSDALARLQQEAGSPSTMLYNAANLRWGSLLDDSAATLIADFAVNVAGALTAVRSVLPAMRAGGGTILLTGSMFADQPQPQFGSLSIGKAALRNLAGSLAVSLKATAVRVHYLDIRGRVTADDPVRNPAAIAEQCWRLHAEAATDATFVPI